MKCLGYIKFNEERWLRVLMNGNMSFSCAGKFIEEELRTGDDTRGDKLEAVFAHLKKNDKRIQEYKEQFQDDLEVIDDRDLVFLRRKSSCLIPIFCVYSICEEQFVAEDIDEKTCKLSFDFPEDMYKGFSNDPTKSALFFQAEPFDASIKRSFEKEGIGYIQKRVCYLEKSIEEFLIEPTCDRKELFYKSKKYAGQNEVRIILPNLKLNRIDDRKNVSGLKIDDSYKHLFGYRVGIRIIGKK